MNSEELVELSYLCSSYVNSGIISWSYHLEIFKSTDFSFLEKSVALVH